MFRKLRYEYSDWNDNHYGGDDVDIHCDERKGEDEFAVAIRNSTHSGIIHWYEFVTQLYRHHCYDLDADGDGSFVGRILTTIETVCDDSRRSECKNAKNTEVQSLSDGLSALLIFFHERKNYIGISQVCSYLRAYSDDTNHYYEKKDAADKTIIEMIHRLGSGSRQVMFLLPLASRKLQEEILTILYNQFGAKENSEEVDKFSDLLLCLFSSCAMHKLQMNDVGNSSLETNLRRWLFKVMDSKSIDITSLIGNIENSKIILTPLLDLAFRRLSAAKWEPYPWINDQRSLLVDCDYLDELLVPLHKSDESGKDPKLNVESDSNSSNLSLVKLTELYFVDARCRVPEHQKKIIASADLTVRKLLVRTDRLVTALGSITMDYISFTRTWSLWTDEVDSLLAPSDQIGEES